MHVKVSYYLHVVHTLAFFQFYTFTLKKESCVEFNVSFHVDFVFFATP